MSNFDPVDEILQPSYMAGFRCIGGSCEEHCCQGWRILIDRANYKKVQKAMGRKAEDRARFGKFYKRNRSGHDREGTFARIDMKKEGEICPFVEESGLCELHRRFGEEYLSTTCRTYPRRLARVGEKQELCATLSCPEIARKCLLDPEGSSLTALPSRDCSVEGVSLTYNLGCTSDPYYQYVDEIREIVLQLLSARQYPMASRLFFVAYFANRIGSFFSKGGQGFSEELLAAEVDRIANPEFVTELHRKYRELDASMELPMNIIQTILFGKSSDRSLHDLLMSVWKVHGYHQEGDNLSFRLNDDDALYSGNMTTGYRERASKLYGLYSSRIDQYLESYSRNFWFGDLYVDSPDLLSHMQSLAVRLAIISFLFYSHPALSQIMEGDAAAGEASEDILDRVAVEVYSKFSRAVEHDPVLLKGILGSLEEQGMKSLAHSVQLLKFTEAA